MLFKKIYSTVEKFSETTSIHGIGHVFDSGSKVLDKFLWLFVTIFAASVAIYMSLNTWHTWNSSPILTTVSSTGLPIKNIEFPAITICSQGLIKEVIDKVFDKQFEDYISNKGLKLNDSNEALLRKNYTNDLYPGATTSPESLINVLASDNPTETIEAQSLSDPNGTCVDVPSDCEAPWFNPKTAEEIFQKDSNICFYEFGQSFGSKDDCFYVGGSTVHFSNGPSGLPEQFLSILLKQGEWSHINRTKFWYKSFTQKDGQNIQACQRAGLNDFGDFIYEAVDCSKEELRLCFRAARDCSLGSQSHRKKRNLISNIALDSIFVKEKRIAREEQAGLTRANYVSNFLIMDLKKSFPALFEILWYTQIPCFDIIGVTSAKLGEFGLLKSCFWKGQKMPCSMIFQTFPTDKGMCCSFNIAKAESMFKDGKYQEMVSKLQNKDRKKAAENSFDFKSELNDLISEPGQSKGLSLVLDGHSNLLSGGTVTEDYDGFYAIIDEKHQYPLTDTKSILIKPGHRNYVSMGATKITSSNIDGIPTEKRNCLFKDERKLKIHKDYTQANCFLECKLEFAQSSINTNLTSICMPWFYPISDESKARICDPWEANEFRRNMKIVPYDQCDHCLPDCDKTIYTSSVTAAPFRPCDFRNLGTSFLCDFDQKLYPPIWGQNVLSQYQEEANEIPDYISKEVETNIRQYVDKKAAGNEVFKAANEKKTNYDAYQKDIAMVTFFFDTTTAMEFSREPKMTTIQYISQIGGLLGLWLGFSIISAVEILYWCLFRIPKLF